MVNDNTKMVNKQISICKDLHSLICSKNVLYLQIHCKQPHTSLENHNVIITNIPSPLETALQQSSTSRGDQSWETT